MHAEETHGDAVPHCPLASQVCTPLPEHWVAPGEHTPVQTPETHAVLVQATVPDQLPPASQTCGI